MLFFRRFLVLLRVLAASWFWVFRWVCGRRFCRGWTGRRFPGRLSGIRCFWWCWVGFFLCFWFRFRWSSLRAVVHRCNNAGWGGRLVYLLWRVWVWRCWLPFRYVRVRCCLLVPTRILLLCLETYRSFSCHGLKILWGLVLICRRFFFLRFIFFRRGGGSWGFTVSGCIIVGFGVLGQGGRRSSRGVVFLWGGRRGRVLGLVLV